MYDFKKIKLDQIPTELLIDLVISAKAELKNRKKSASTDRRRCFISTFDPGRYEDVGSARAAVKKHNSKSLLSIRNPSMKCCDRAAYLPHLIAQDWSDLYPRDGDSGDYYVYCHVNPSDKVFVTAESGGGNYGGLPFYVGKGIGRRAYDLKRNQGHGKMIRSAINFGWTTDDIVYIAFKGLSERAALETEAKLIYFFGTVYESGKNKRKNGCLYNLDVPKKPEFVGKMERIPTRLQIHALQHPEDGNHKGEAK